ncbi:MAG: TonB-dependent receptor, partial [Chitinophagia bacterium]|nr:TonB-dependent receptor [Chitinophagia bacterium]
SFFFSNCRLDANLGFQQSNRREYSHPEQPYQDVPGLFLQLNTFNYDIKYFLPELHKWSVAVGINGMYQTNDVTKGTEFVIPSYQQFDIGSFVTLKKEIKNWNFSGGLRWDSRSFNNKELYTKANAISSFDEAVTGNDTIGANQVFSNYFTVFNGFSGSLGVSYVFNKQWAVKLNVARGYRAPNISEISANGVHPGTGFFQIGNGNFKPEFSNQIDVGISYSSKKVEATASVFVNRIDNYIYNQRLAAANGSDSLSQSGSQNYPTYKFRQGSVLLYGAEASIDFHITQQLHFDNSISLLYGDNNSFTGAEKTAATQYIPFMPPLRYIAELKYEMPMLPKLFDKPYAKVQW